MRASRPAGRIGREGREGGRKVEPGAAGPRGDPAACGSGGDLSDIQCHNWFTGPKPFASWAQDIDCLDRRQCFPAYEPLYSFAPSNVLLDPNHTCPVPQTLIYRTPQTFFLGSNHCFPGPLPFVALGPRHACNAPESLVANFPTIGFSDLQPLVPRLQLLISATPIGLLRLHALMCCHPTIGFRRTNHRFPRGPNVGRRANPPFFHVPQQLVYWTPTIDVVEPQH